MTVFSQLSQSAQCAFCVVFLISSQAALSMALISSFRSRRDALWGFGLSALSWIICQLLLCHYTFTCQMADHSVYADIGAELPVPALAFEGVLLPVLLMLYGVRLFKTDRGAVRLSVKEAVDDLPTGICCCLENGRVILVNDVMERISLELSGRTVLSGSELWQQICRASGGEGLPVRAGDRIYTVVKSPVAGMDGIHQIIAADVTDEYAGLLEVSEKNRQLRELSERLRAAVGEAERLSVEKEYLDAKIRVHSGLGGLLAATARYMRGAGEGQAAGPVQADETGGSGSSSDRQRLAELVSEWERLPSALLDREPSRKSSYEALMRAAEDVGIKIVLDGELPEKEPFRRVMLTAVGECITNTFRHAGGDELRISWDGSRAELTNNGRPPEGPVAEKGGLADLRRLAEGAGAVMTIESSPVFRLVIHW